MPIKKIKVSNFKSFKDLEIELGKFNVVIGANASGKSNFVEIFRFLRDIATEGLDNAISLQGGVEYLRNMNIGSSKDFSLEVVFETSEVNPQIRVETIYRFAFKLSERSEFEIIEDKLTIQIYTEIKQWRGEIIISSDKDNIEVNYKLPNDLGNILQKKQISYSFIPNFTKEGDILKCNIEFKPSFDISQKDPLILLLLLSFMFSTPESLQFLKKAEPHTLLIEPLGFFQSSILRDIFKIFLPNLSDISIYEFDPKLPKEATPISGMIELEEDGSNLAIVLKNILEDKEKKREFSNLVNYLLPFVEELDIEKFTDKSLFFKLKETYASQYLPASLLSDGTINIIALIIALYFERKSLIIIEEPERNIHPSLLSKVVDMMKEASGKKQIIVTTHNPEIVKYAGLENILLISRDKEGFSVISRPKKDKEEVKGFLENELGIEELYVQNLLG